MGHLDCSLTESIKLSSSQRSGRPVSDQNPDGVGGGNDPSGCRRRDGHDSRDGITIAGSILRFRYLRQLNPGAI